jgi:ABC-type spermidine/putrescine transport system permease subunit II
VAAPVCPDCLHVVSVDRVLAYSNDLVCSNCGKSLEISLLSRYLSAFAGLIAAVAVWWAASKHYANDSWALAWVLPIVFSYFALSIVAPLVLALTADLQMRSVEAAPISHEVTAGSHHPSH